MTTALDARRSPLAVLPPDFFALSGTKKLDAILSLEDPAGFVQALRGDEFYLLLQDIGPTDAIELASLATPQQRVTLFDFDAWDKDELVPGEIDDWLDLLWYAGVDVAVETVGALDPELLTAYLLKSVVAIFDRMEEDAIRDQSGGYEVVYSPDNDFAFFVDPDEPDAVAHVRRVLDLLWRGDPELGRGVVFAARAGLVTEQSELAYGFRAGRLADLGFSEPEVAWQLYAPVGLQALREQLLADTPRARGGDAALHAALVWSGRPAGFLNAALAQADAPEAFLVDFGYLVNMAVVTTPEGIAHLDPERLGPLARRVHATVSLGLEWASDGQLARAAELLAGGVAPLVLHQAGHALAMGLARRAARLAPQVRGLLPAEDDALLTALATRPAPSYAAPGATLPAAFETLAQVAEADARVTALEALVGAFEAALGFDRKAFDAHVFEGLDPADKPFVTLRSLAATLAAHLLVADAPSFDPLDGAALTLARDQLSALDARVAEWTQRAPGARVALEVGAAALRDALGEVQGPVDPRFLQGAVLTRD